jgi:putative transposase
MKKPENSHLPLRRRGRAFLPFRPMWSLQKLAAVHASVAKCSITQCSLSSQHDFKLNRAAALAEWRGLGA